MLEVMRMLLLLKDRVLKRIVESLPARDENVVAIVLFGSVARGDFRPDSDIDLLILTKDPKRTRRIFADLQAEFIEEGVVVSALYLTPEDYERGIDPLIKVIREEGVVLWRRSS